MLRPANSAEVWAQLVRLPFVESSVDGLLLHVQNPHFANITAREFSVLEAPTRVTNGAPVATAA